MQEVIIVDSAEAEVASLTDEIKSDLMSAQQSLIQACVKLAEVRTKKLYKVLDCRNFEEYCEQKVGITRRQGIKYASVGGLIQNVKSTSHFSQIEHIGVEKLCLMSKLDEGEISSIMEHTDLESISVKKLKEEIKTLRGEVAEIKKNPLKSQQVKDLEAEVASLRQQVEDLKSQKPTQKIFKNKFEQYKGFEEDLHDTFIQALIFLGDNRQYKDDMEIFLKQLINLL